jgi:hypothetical protein
MQFSTGLAQKQRQATALEMDVGILDLGRSGAAPVHVGGKNAGGMQALPTASQRPAVWDTTAATGWRCGVDRGAGRD